jgi:hypothetical protein
VVSFVIYLVFTPIIKIVKTVKLLTAPIIISS